MWRLNGGILLGPDGRKMSKSFGNIVDPMDVIRRYGADATRMYVCFIGPYEDTYPWNENGIRATYRLVNTIYDLRKRVRGKVIDDHIERAYHRLVQRVSSMLENIKMNTAVSEIMIFSNELKRAEAIDQEIWRGFLKVIAPFAPFIAEELWQESHGYKEFKAENSIHLQKWPEYNPELAREEVLRIPVQVNGKVREQVELSGEEDEADVQAAVYALPKVAGLMEGKEVVRFMYVPKKIVSIVVK
jgi:leucyl-tRNA synthetase